MKAVILAGGRGTRLAEETSVRPKPMVEVGGFPMIWHIMKIYSHYGVNDFVICLGYLGNVIKEFFANYFLYSSDVTIDLTTNQLICHAKRGEAWRVTLVDTGGETLTAGRLKRVRHFLNNETFLMTYGDGVADINIEKLLAEHRAGGRHATMTVVHPPARFGAVTMDGNKITSFVEKPQSQEGFINGGFFVLEPPVFDYIEGDHEGWEHEPLLRLVADGQLSAYCHHGFWQAMDTLRDRMILESLWSSGTAPWKVWA